MTVLNSGLMFKKEYESDANAVRRFLLANPNTTREDYKSLGNNSLSKDSFLNLVKKTQSRQYWISNQWLFLKSWYGMSLGSHSKYVELTSKLKQCPICSREVFHCNLYSLSWVKRCPIHGVNLTNKCPECKKPWDLSDTWKRNFCPTCGTSRPKSLAKRKKQIQEHSGEIRNTLGLFWSFTQMNKIFAKILHYDFVANNIDSGILLGSEEFPELAITFYPQYFELFRKIGSPASRLEETIFNGKHVSLLELQKTPVIIKMPKTLTNTAIVEIDNEINSVFKRRYRDHIWRNNTGYIYVDRLDDYDINQVSYVIWSLIVTSKTNPIISQAWWMRIFDILDVPQPEPPAMAHLICSSDGKQFIKPCNDFRLWLYKIQLKNLFIYIYKHVQLLKLKLEGNNPRTYDSYWDGDRHIWPPKYNWFRIKLLSKTEFHIVYKPLPSWSEVLDKNNLIEEYPKGARSYNPRSTYTLECWNDSYKRYCIANTASSLYECIRKTI